MKNSRLQKLSISLLALAVIGSALWLMARSRSAVPEETDTRLRIVTTLFPLYDLARQIGGPETQVSLLLPPGIEAHSFEPKPTDIAKIANADIFIYTGKAMEPWAEKILRGLDNKKLKAIDSSAGLTLLPAVFHDADEPAGAADPHLWLDFSNDQKLAETFAAAMAAADPLHGEDYAKRAAALKERLAGLDADYRTSLADCQEKTIIYGGHYAFGYLAARYGLRYLAAQGIAPDAEPTAKDLAALIDQIKKDKVDYVFYEELSSPKIAETLAQETQAKLLFLNAAHNLSRDQFDRGLGFIEIMKNNLQTLKTGLHCR